MSEPVQETTMVDIEELEQDHKTENPKTPKKKKKKKRHLTKAGIMFFRIVLVAAIVVAGYSSFEIYSGLKQYQEGTSAYEDLAASAVIASEDAVAQADTSFKYIDFQKLADINSDVVGWLTLDDTVIDYPLVRGTDNEYYLHHLFDGTSNNLGTVFMDYRNSADFTDRNTILYAHHMRNGSMFAAVEEYRTDPDYITEHPFFRLITPDGDYYVYVFAGILADAYTEYNVVDFEDDDAFMAFVQDKIDNSTFSSDVEVTAQDQIVTFSTCSYAVSDGRYALFGKLVKAN